MKKITLLCLFLMGSITSTFAQFTEGFESGIPATWTVINQGDASTWESFTQALWVIEGTTSATITYDEFDAHDDYLITPAITVVAGVNDRFSFWAQSYDPLYPEEFTLEVSTTTATAGAFTSIDTVAPANDGNYHEYTYDLSAYVGQTIYIGMHSVTLNQWRISVDHVVNDTPPTAAPNCVTLTAPANGSTTVDYTAAFNLTWDAPTTGGPVESYDVYLDTNATPTTLLGNQTATTRSITGLLPSTTYYWTVIAKNSVGDATGCTTFSFTTIANPFAPYCGPLQFTNNVEPITLVNFAGINNTTSALVGTANGSTIIAHENFTSITGNVSAGGGYTITLKGNTDGNYTTKLRMLADWNHDGDFDDTSESYDVGDITNSTGTDAVQLVGLISVPADAALGSTRMRVIKKFNTYSDACNTPNTGFGQAEDYTLNVTALPADLPDYANLQWPPTATIPSGGNVTVYGRVYEPGVTPGAGGGAGIQAWVGVSPIGSNTNPNTWISWTAATYNQDYGNDDEWMAAIGSTLAPGTYYYATRFQLNGGAFVYGGIDASNNGNFWDGTTYNSGVLTVSPPPPPANDECGGAVALTPGGTFATNPVTGTSVNATATDGLVPSCQTSIASNVWYTVQVPASGNITIETQVTGSGYTDSVVVAYSGTCGGTLTPVGCDDDGGAGANNLMSILSLTGQTPGSTLYISVWRYSLGAGVNGTFTISAYDASLANASFDNANFTYYPNPVKNVLNLSYSKEISNVEVYNLLGQKVISNKLNTTDAQIDMSNLSNGAYMVRVTSDNQVKTIKVIKE